jgi:hypothetical protein
MDPESLRAAVEQHAQARVEGAEANFASLMTPQAILQLRDEALPPSKSFAMVELSESGESGSSMVRFSGRDEYELAERWQRIDGLWRVVDVGVTRREHWFKRITRRAPAPEMG